MILHLVMPGDQSPHKVYIVQFLTIHSCCYCSCSWNQYTGEATGISFADIFRALNILPILMLSLTVIFNSAYLCYDLKLF